MAEATTKHKVIVNGPDDGHASYRDSWAGLYDKGVLSANGWVAYFVERFQTTKYFKKLRYLADTFDFVLEVGATDELQLQADQRRYAGNVYFTLTGEAKVLKDMLTSLYGDILPLVQQAKEKGTHLTINPAPDPED